MLLQYKNNTTQKYKTYKHREILLNKIQKHKNTKVQKYKNTKLYSKHIKIQKYL